MPGKTKNIKDYCLPSQFLTKGLNAGILIRTLAKEIKGGGGGQAFFATAGGSDANGLDAALAKTT